MSHGLNIYKQNGELSFTSLSPFLSVSQIITITLAQWTSSAAYFVAVPYIVNPNDFFLVILSNNDANSIGGFNRWVIVPGGINCFGYGFRIRSSLMLGVK